MEFYEEFAEKYDMLVSYENRVKREAKFYDSIFKNYNIKTVLDCACGTGHHVSTRKEKIFPHFLQKRWSLSFCAKIFFLKKLYLTLYILIQAAMHFILT